MSKHHVPTQAEVDAFAPPRRTTQLLEALERASALPPSEIKVLDWGCGRGLETLWLRERGYDAFGVDPDPEPIEKGLRLFAARGQPASALQALGPTSATAFPDECFHLTLSYQVLEHVAELDAVASELFRVTRPGGLGYHVFPAHKGPVEGHLGMPLVHWLPKNGLRRGALTMCTLLGVEPGWPRLSGLRPLEKARAYHEYSVLRTFYRRPRDVLEAFSRAGFRSAFRPSDHPRVAGHPLLGPLVRRRGGRRIVDALLTHFVSSELYLEKAP